jgi:hypothetical protein
MGMKRKIGLSNAIDAVKKDIYLKTACKNANK